MAGKRVKGALPNLLIAGVPKGGTTSLFRWLSGHDDICASDRKELDHFAVLRRPGGTLPPVASYAAHFSHCRGQRYRMEASPSYCYAGTPVVRAIREVLGSPRIVLSLRDPVRRFWSSYTYLQSMGRLGENTTCDAYIDQCLARERSDGGHTSLSVGRYVTWLGAWLDEFGADVHLLFAEHLFSAPHVELGRLLAWLGLEVVPLVDGTAHNRTVTPRSRFVARMAYQSTALTDMLDRAPRARAALGRAYRRLNTTPQVRVMSPAERARLTNLYAPWTAQLAELLASRDLPDVAPWVTTSA